MPEITSMIAKHSKSDINLAPLTSLWALLEVAANPKEGKKFLSDLKSILEGLEDRIEKVAKIGRFEAAVAGAEKSLAEAEAKANEIVGRATKKEKSIGERDVKSIERESACVRLEEDLAKASKLFNAKKSEELATIDEERRKYEIRLAELDAREVNLAQAERDLSNRQRLMEEALGNLRTAKSAA